MQAILQNPFLKYLFGFFPKLTTVILATVCFALGLIFAYGTVSWVDGDPSRLHQSWQNEWVRGLEARLRAPQSQADGQANIAALLGAVDDPVGIITAENISNPQLRALADQVQATAAPTPPSGGIVANIVLPIVWIIVFVIVYVLLFFLWAFLVWPYVRDAMGLGGPKQVDDGAAALTTQKIKEDRIAREALTKSVVVANQYGNPIIRKPSLFKAGFGNYDDSFNIETEEGTYYGEAGASIAERVGENNGATAIEIWMFDKDQFAETPTGIFVSEYAFNDPAIRSRLETRGTLVKIADGAQIVLETPALYIEATIMKFAYDASATTPNSVLTELTTQIIAWSKAGVAAGTVPVAMPAPTMAAAATPMPTPTMPAMPAMPSAMPAPAIRPLSAPAPTMPPPSRPPVDDPFGGTGDFTPINPNR